MAFTSSLVVVHLVLGRSCSWRCRVILLQSTPWWCSVVWSCPAPRWCYAMWWCPRVHWMTTIWHCPAISGWFTFCGGKVCIQNSNVSYLLLLLLYPMCWCGLGTVLTLSSSCTGEITALPFIMQWSSENYLKFETVTSSLSDSHCCFLAGLRFSFITFY